MSTTRAHLAMVLGVVLLAAPACAGRQNAARPAHGDRTLLTRQEMIENHFTTVYDAIEALHPNWLRARGTNSFQNPQEVKVYQDATHLGGVEALRLVSIQNVEYIRYYDPIAATARYGIDHTQGAIFIATHL